MFNSTINDHLARLENAFGRKDVLRLGELRRALQVRSRTTVFFVLKSAGYYTSYSHAGRYYTLNHIPKFNDEGLWSSGQIRFSKHGTLRATLILLVCKAPAGRTHEELEMILGLRVHDTLLSLVEAHALKRESLQSVYVYLDPDPKRATSQSEARRHQTGALQKAVKAELPATDADLTIGILVAVIHLAKADPDAVTTHLRKSGSPVTPEQVQRVFERYDLVKKKGRSRSPRSRR